MKEKERINELNKKFRGKFRQLTQQEKTKYEKALNKKGNEWYSPYAIREETNDIVCTHDTTKSFSEFLFINIKNIK